MPISDVVNLSISVSGAGPTRAGFGEPLVAGFGLWFSSGVREYSSTADMVADGASVTNPTYLAVANIFDQNPAPPAVKVAPRTLAYAQVLDLTCLSTSALDTYVIQLRTPGGSWHVVTVPSTGVVNTDAASIRTAITALSISHLTVGGSAALVTLTMASGFLLDVQPGPAKLITFADVTPDPGIATDLANILVNDPSWYFLLLDSQSPAEITAAAAWAESNGKLFVYNCSDSACADPASTTDVFYTEKQLSHARSAGLFSQTQLLSYSAAAWVGRLATTDAGSDNWAFKTLSNVFVDTLTTTQIHAVENKNASVYTSLLGLPLTQFGKQPGGEWIDITRGTDSLSADIQAAIVGMQANALKIPFTDPGVDMYRSALTGVLSNYVARGFIAASPPFTVSLPKVADVSSANKAARNLPNVFFAAELAGAINSTTIKGVLTQ